MLHGVSSLKNVKENDVLVIHNGSNPLVTIDEIASCIVEAKAHGASVCAFPLKDTIKKADGGFVKQTLDRSDVWQMQTPQCVQYGILKKAFDAAKKAKKYYTDDVALVEALDKKVKIVPCSTTNFKITTPDDLAMAEKLVANDKRTRQMSDSPGMRVGIGQDHHRFVQKGKKPLVLGGYVIPNEQGLDANSDGDIILHSLFNAISSALGGRSLSITADDMCKKGVTDSRKYLEPLLAEMKAQGYSLGNVSLSIEAKKPTLEPHHDKIKESLVHIVGILGNRIGLTFTTGEELTGMGRGEGMACSCMITLTK